MRPTFKLMGKTLLFCLALCWMTNVGRAQAPALPTIRILPEDVVQNTIQQIRFNTNSFAVRWTYTEEGARKKLAFWEAHEGQKVKTAVGSFETGSGERIFRPMPPAFTNYAQWKEGWLKRRTDKIFGVSENDAKAIAAGLKSKG